MMAKRNPITDALRQVAKTLTNAPKNFTRLMRARGSKAAPRALARLQADPGPVKYLGRGVNNQPTLRWTSDRQRKAYFASDGFGRGIPTQRKGTIAGKWKTAFIPDSKGGMLILENDDPAATFVQGFDQQGFHADTGWVTTAQVSDQFFAEGGDSVAEIWYEAADPLEGV